MPPSPSELLEATTADCELPASGSVSGVSGGDGGGAAGPRCNVATYWWGGLVKLQVGGAFLKLRVCGCVGLVKLHVRGWVGCSEAAGARVGEW